MIKRFLSNFFSREKDEEREVVNGYDFIESDFSHQEMRVSRNFTVHKTDAHILKMSIVPGPWLVTTDFTRYFTVHDISKPKQCRQVQQLKHSEHVYNVLSMNGLVITCGDYRISSWKLGQKSEKPTKKLFVNQGIMHVLQLNADYFLVFRKDGVIAFINKFFRLHWRKTYGPTQHSVPCRITENYFAFESKSKLHLWHIQKRTY